MIEVAEAHLFRTWPGETRDSRRAEHIPTPAMSAAQVTLSHVSTKDQVLSSELHGEALLTARRPELQPLIDHLREVAQGRDDIRVECAGTIAGSWFYSAARRGEELIAAGLLMLAGPVDLDELDRWMRVGCERGMAVKQGGAVRPNMEC
jgi:hypothetical protein